MNIKKLAGILLIGILATACKSKAGYYPLEGPPQPLTPSEIAILRAAIDEGKKNMPSFPGGAEAMMKFIGENFRYPENDSTNAQGRVNLEFIVLSTGKIDSIKVVRSVTPDIDKEVVRVVESMPLWIPGKKDGEPTDIRCFLPIYIRRE